jgi:hypothetical protein
MRGWFILGRIGMRSGAAIWRHRVALLLASVVVLVFGAYELGFAGPSVTNGDCADTAMAAVTHVDDSAARAAYACLGAGMRNTNEDQFIAGMRDRAVPSGQFDRVAEKRTIDGGRIVFYTVDAGKGGTAVGYIVYLDPEGKITRVE